METIVTDRLIIREAKESDIPWIIEIENKPGYKEYLWQGDFEEHKSEIGSDEFLLLIIEDKEENTIGYAMVELNHKALAFLLRRIAIAEQDKGYGEEAMKALMELCFKTMDYNRFWLDVSPDNPRAIHLYESLGLVKEGVLRENDRPERGFMDQIVYGILKREYDQL